MNEKNGAIEYIKKECSMLYDSGGINPDDYLQEWILPKILFLAALKHLDAQHSFVNKHFKKEIKNLSHF